MHTRLVRAGVLHLCIQVKREELGQVNCRIIYLLSCVGQKRATPIHARDLYTSPWFRKARTYADGTGQPWFILSAQYGLVHPDEMIAPYDLTLNTMPVADRRRWASKVLTQLEPHLNGIRSVTFLAGRRYREFLEPSLRSRGLGPGTATMLGQPTPQRTLGANLQPMSPDPNDPLPSARP